MSLGCGPSVVLWVRVGPKGLGVLRAPQWEVMGCWFWEGRWPGGWSKGLDPLFLVVSAVPPLRSPCHVRVQHLAPHGPRGAWSGLPRPAAVCKAAVRGSPVTLLQFGARVAMEASAEVHNVSLVQKVWKALSKLLCSSASSQRYRPPHPLLVQRNSSGGKRRERKKNFSS